MHIQIFNIKKEDLISLWHIRIQLSIDLGLQQSEGQVYPEPEESDGRMQAIRQGVCHRDQGEEGLRQE